MTVTRQPHQFVSVDLAVDGTIHRGVAADGLSPVWFLKETPFGAGLDAMLGAIRAACEHAESVASRRQRLRLLARGLGGDSSGGPPTRSTYPCCGLRRQPRRAGGDRRRPPRPGGHVRGGRPRGAPDTRLGIFDDELAGRSPAGFSPRIPCGSSPSVTPWGWTTRSPARRRDAGRGRAPETLVEFVRAGGVDQFKVKVGGDAERDVQRLTRIAGVLDTEIDRKYAATLDANERFADATAFCAF